MLNTKNVCLQFISTNVCFSKKKKNEAVSISVNANIDMGADLRGGDVAITPS